MNEISEKATIGPEDVSSKPLQEIKARTSPAVAFTPGPWEWDSDTGDLMNKSLWRHHCSTPAAARYKCPDGIVLNTEADVLYDGEGEEYGAVASILCQPADRLLISAAPDLYEALNWSLQTIDRFFTQLGFSSGDDYNDFADARTVARAALSKARGEQS